MRYVTCGAVAGRPAEAGMTEEEAGATDDEAGAVKREQWLVFFMLFQILQPV